MYKFWPLAVALLMALAPPALAGSRVPTEISGADLVSGKLTRADASTGTLVIAFLSARCPCSASHEPVLKALHARFAARGIRFIGVNANADEPTEISKPHFTTSALPFPVLRDEDARLADALGALKTPHVFVLRDGAIAFEGGVDDSQVAGNAKSHYLEDALVALAEGRKPTVPRARALGCVIGRK